MWHKFLSSILLCKTVIAFIIILKLNKIEKNISNVIGYDLIKNCVV